MNFSEILTAYINLNALIATSYISLALYPILAGLAKKTIGARSLLKLHYTVLLLLFIALLLYPLLPERRTFNPTVQIWSAQSLDTFAEDYSPHADGGYLGLPGVREAEAFDTDNAKLAVAGFILSLLLLGVLSLFNDLRKLFIMRKGSYLIRRCGSVSIYAKDRKSVV